MSLPFPSENYHLSIRHVIPHDDRSVMHKGIVHDHMRHAMAERIVTDHMKVLEHEYHTSLDLEVYVFTPDQFWRIVQEEATRLYPRKLR